MLSSCKTTYRLGQSKARAISDNRLYKAVIDSSLHYNSLYIKRFSANYKVNGKGKSFKGSIKILRDSVIWVQINAPIGGLEVLRIYITPDTVKILNRLKKTYSVTDLSYLSEKLKFNLDFNTLQSILTNHLFDFKNYNEKRKPFIRSF